MTAFHSVHRLYFNHYGKIYKILQGGQETRKYGGISGQLSWDYASVSVAPLLGSDLRYWQLTTT